MRFWFVVLGAALGAAFLSAQVPASPITLVLRYDDLRLCSETAGDRAVVESTLQHRLRLTIGAIPVSEDESVVNEACIDQTLRDGIESGAIEIAQHGYKHQLYSHTVARQPSEFYGRPSPQQLDIIKRGRDALSSAIDAPIRTFIPPWNSYDDQTVSSLTQLGFQTLSAHSIGAGWSGSVKAVPVTVEMRDLRAAIGTARSGNRASSRIVALFHLFDFVEEDPSNGWMTAADFDELCRWLAQQKDITTVTVSEAARLSPDLNGQHQSRVERLLYLGSLVPRAIRPSFLEYPSVASVGREIAKMWIRLGLFIGAISIVATLCGIAVTLWSYRSVPGLRVAHLVVTGVAVTLVAYALKDAFFHLYRASALAIGSGLLASLPIAAAAKRRSAL